jgi:lipoprotein signal peptidase
VHTRRALLVGTALLFATIDLVQKSLSYAEFHHARTPYVTLVMAIGAGIACGGALGNLVSLLAWAQGVPDPFVVTGATHGLAFNLADVFAVGGDSILLSVVILLGVRRRMALREPV